jgi:hypothetical protein
LFQQAAIALRITAPAAPRKSRRKRSGEDDKERTAFIRKHMRRLFRKMARQTSEDWRDAPPTFDGDAWHRHQQSVAGVRCDHQGPERGLQDGGANYPSATL